MSSSKDNLGHHAPHPAATAVNTTHGRSFEATDHGHFIVGHEANGIKGRDAMQPSRKLSRSNPDLERVGDACI